MSGERFAKRTPPAKLECLAHDGHELLAHNLGEGVDDGDGDVVARPPERKTEKVSDSRVHSNRRRLGTSPHRREQVVASDLNVAQGGTARTGGTSGGC